MLLNSIILIFNINFNLEYFFKKTGDKLSPGVSPILGNVPENRG
jgi:hypothetical protein